MDKKIIAKIESHKKFNPIHNQEHLAYLADIKQRVKNDRFRSKFHTVTSPCHCIQDSCYLNKNLAQAVKYATDQKDLKERKKTISKLLPRIVKYQKENYALRSENITVNFYGNKNQYLNNLATLTQNNLDLQHAQSLLSHVQQCDAALTLQSWRRKTIAKQQTEKMREYAKKEHLEQKIMKQEEILTKRFISSEIQKELQRIKEQKTAETLRVEDARKEAQRQKNKENIQKQVIQENEKKETEKLKKEQEQENLKLKQKAQAQLKKEQQSAHKKAEQQKEAADLAYLTDMAKQQSEVILKKEKTQNNSIVCKASTKTLSDTMQSEVDDKPQISHKTIPLQNHSYPSAASADDTEENFTDWISQRQNFIKQLDETKIEAVTIQQQLDQQNHETKMNKERSFFQEKTLKGIISIHQNSIEYYDFMRWQEMQRIKNEQRDHKKEEQRKKNLKTILKCKHCDRESKKIELAEKLEHDFAYNSSHEKSVIELFKSYNKALHLKTSLESIEQFERIFIETEHQLRNKGESITWYLFSNPEIYTKLKQQYLSEQRNINYSERVKSMEAFERLKNNSNQNLSKDAYEKLQNDYLKMIPKISRIQKLHVLERIHTNGGILDISKFLYTNQSSIDIETYGKLSKDILDKAEIEIKHNLSQQQHNLNIVIPTAISLLTQSGIEPSLNIIHAMIHTSVEVTRVPKPNKSSIDFLAEMQKSMFLTLQRANELTSNPDTFDQMADKVKINSCILKAFMDIADKKKNRS